MNKLFIIYFITAYFVINTACVDLENSKTAQVVGGYQNQPLNTKDSGVKIAINHAISTLSSGNGLFSNGIWTATKILSIETQVVAGKNYKITAIFTNQQSNATKKVQFIVFEQPWTKTYRLTSHKTLKDYT